MLWLTLWNSRMDLYHSNVRVYCSSDISISSPAASVSTIAFGVHAR